MAIAIQVGPPVITINQGNTFVVSRTDGSIRTDEALGVFAEDTRFVSYYDITLNRTPWKLLTSTAITYYSARYHFTNNKMALEAGELDPDRVSLTLGRTVGEGVHEDYEITNYNTDAVDFHLGVVIRSDFADIFDVHDRKLTERGHMESSWDPQRHELATVYEHDDFHRELIVRIVNSPEPPRFANGRLTFDIRLRPKETWHTCVHLIPVYNGRRHEPTYGCNQLEGGSTEADALMDQWKSKTTRVKSSNVDVERAFAQSVEDMGALRLHQEDFSDDVWLPAAGVPWFVTVFGRDSLIVSLQNMAVYYPFAHGALQKLGELQALSDDEWRDAEPGKILHEIRFGELAHFHKIPHTPYYGTADATILYLLVLAEAYAWEGKKELIERYLPVAERCLRWIDQRGDFDGDGFQEYKSRSRDGYENVGWKDSGDAVVYADGTQVLQPKGLCELQGYVYAAKLRMADLYEALGNHARAGELRGQAMTLKQRFNEVFWMPEEKFLAYGLDGNKQLIRAIASNPGHCLWSGIVDDDKSEAVVRRLLAPDMFSGWGIRTLSADNPAFNPFSYQLGSVWPHDNSIIAAGMKRYGHWKEANTVARAIFDAARYFLSYRLPELYAGLHRRPGSFPVQYLGANIPQAWAAGSIFQLIQTIAGLRADAANQRLFVDPTLPDWLPDLHVQNLMIGGCRLDIAFNRTERGETEYRVTRNEGNVRVEHDPQSMVEGERFDEEDSSYY